MASRIGQKHDRLARHEQDASGEALHHAEQDQQVQSSRKGGNGAGRAHDQGRADDQTARVNTIDQPRSGHESDQLRSGISDIEPSELIGSCIGVADDIAAPERQDRAGDRLSQCGEHYARDEKYACRRSIAIPRGDKRRGHESLPSSISTRADRPGT